MRVLVFAKVQEPKGSADLSKKPLLPLIFGSSNIPDKNSKVGRKFYYLEKLNFKNGRKFY